MPKYQVTGWIPTAMWATVEVEAPTAEAAVEKGRALLEETGDWEYCDFPSSENMDSIRAESEEDRVNDTFEWDRGR